MNVPGECLQIKGYQSSNLKLWHTQKFIESIDAKTIEVDLQRSVHETFESSFDLIMWHLK